MLATSTLLDSLHRLDGVATVRELIAEGVAPRTLGRAAADHRILRVRPGVYAHPEAAAEVVRAARVGGRLAGASAAGARGAWTPPAVALTVQLGRSARLLDPDRPELTLDRARTDVRVGWTRNPDGRPVGISAGVQIVREVLVSLSPVHAVAVIDSMLRRSLLSPAELARLVGSEAGSVTGSAAGSLAGQERSDAPLPRTLLATLALVDARSDSGSESVVRVALAGVGIVAVPQARIPFSDSERVDLLIGDRLVIECDSRAHHSDPRSRA